MANSGADQLKREDGDQTNWGRIYAAVMASAALMMALLWAFSRAFTPQ